jgi:hypothetical protein
MNEKVIYRYPIKLVEEQEIEINGLQEDYRYVSAKKQIIKIDTIRGIPSMWCLVQPNAPKRKVKLHLYGTGWEMSEDILRQNYLGSFILKDYGEIYHVFIDEV